MEYIKLSTGLLSLKVLKIATCKITDKGVSYLARADCLKYLEELDISNDQGMEKHNN